MHVSRKYSFLIVVLLLVIGDLTGCFAQEGKRQYNSKQNMAVVINKDPEFEGGEKELFKYFQDNLVYSPEAIKRKISGEVMVSFDIMPDSTLTNIRILSGVGSNVDEEIVKLFKKLKFSPSVQNGTPLRMNMIISIPVRATALTDQQN